jgi:predicted CXXCH cytochrome family protein
LSGPATIELRGRQAGDFRPGMPLTDYRIPYRFEGADQMTVVGHVEQMHLSACYQKTESLTCLTCHDPHQSAAPKDKTAYFRQKCLNCHENQPCRLETSERLKKDGTDNCVACHMPRGDTDIPHIAFTHHRIGRHAPQQAAEHKGIPRLMPAYDDSHLSEIDRLRNLGLAYLQACYNPEYEKYAPIFREQALKELVAVDAAGLHDTETLAGLVQLFFLKQDGGRARKYAKQALEANDLTPKIRSVVLTAVANLDYQEAKYAEAAKSFEELVRMNRTSVIWHMLGKCYLRMNQPAQALEALTRAREIRPFRHTIYLGLADAYQLMGDQKKANENRETARWLTEHHQD